MRFAAAIAGVVLLGACSAFPPYAMINGVFLVATDKTMEDHVISVASGKNCSSVRAGTGRSYCEEDELNPSPSVYCYRTLGNITCYDRPDPHNGRQQRVGGNHHNYDRRL